MSEQKSKQEWAPPPENALSEQTVTKFDFLESQRLNADVLDDVQERYEVVAKSLSTALSTTLGIDVEVQVGGAAEAAPPSEASEEASTGFGTPLVKGDGELSGLLWLGQDSVAVLLDLLLGGSGVEPPPINRQLTSLEAPLLHNVLEQINGILISSAEALEIGANKPGETVRDDSIPEQLRRTPLVALDLQLHLHDHAYPVRVYFPAGSSSGRSAARAGGSSPENERAKKLVLLRKLNPTSVRAEVFVRGLSVTVGDLVAVRTGDVLVFQSPRTLPAELALGGVPCFTGRLVTQNGMKALSVRRAIDRAADKVST
jgi:flagellar motor switch protein FliM